MFLELTRATAATEQVIRYHRQFHRTCSGILHHNAVLTGTCYSRGLLRRFEDQYFDLRKKCKLIVLSLMDEMKFKRKKHTFMSINKVIVISYQKNGRQLIYFTKCMEGRNILMNKIQHGSFNFPKRLKAFDRLFRKSMKQLA